MKTPIVYFNGSCNICGPEVSYYKKLARQARANLIFQDISRLAPSGLNQETLLKHLHVRDADGNLLRGVPAFVLIWSRLPGFRYLAMLLNLPVIRHATDGIYRHLIAPWLYRRFRRSFRNVQS